MSRPLPFPTAAAGRQPQRARVLDFLRLLWAIDHGLQRRSKRMERELGVTGVQRLVIRVVGQYPSITPGHLAGILHLHPSTVTGVVQRLHRDGFLLRSIDRSDGRRWLLTLTPRGLAIDRRRQGTVEAVLEKALARLQPHEVVAARRALAAVGEQLSES